MLTWWSDLTGICEDHDRIPIDAELNRDIPIRCSVMFCYIRRCPCAVLSGTSRPWRFCCKPQSHRATTPWQARLLPYSGWRMSSSTRLPRGRAAAVRLTADDNQSLVTAALAGIGIVMCSDWLAAPERAAGHLKPILTDWSVEGEGSIHVVRPSARLTAAKTRSFVHWISERLDQPPWIVAIALTDDDLLNT
jgi:DNA-binding transcriptional LysR family regulator